MKAMIANPEVMYNGEYSNLVNAVETYNFLDTRISVVAWIIEHKGYIDRKDFHNINKLWDDSFVRA